MGMNDWLKPIAAAVAMTLPFLEACAGVVATNDEVPYPQLVSPAGTSTNHTIFLFDGYTRNFDLVGQGLDIGTYNPYIALHIVNQSVIRSSRIWFLGGDYPNKVGESGDPTDYPGHQTCLLDNSSMTTGEFRVGSKNSDNTLIVRNGATMAIGKGLYLDMYDGVGGNAAIVTGNGTSMSVTNGALYVGYGNSSNETLSVLHGAHVTVGTPTITQRLRMRFSHDSTLTVSGAGSTLWVTGNLSLGENSTTCYNNRLIVADGGLLKVDGTFGSASNATKPPSAVTLTDGGAIALKGSYSSHPLLTNLLATGGSTAVTFGPGTGDLAGYTVWQAADDPEPSKSTVMVVCGAFDCGAEIRLPVLRRKIPLWEGRDPRARPLEGFWKRLIGQDFRIEQDDCATKSCESCPKTLRVQSANRLGRIFRVTEYRSHGLFIWPVFGPVRTEPDPPAQGNTPFRPRPADGGTTSVSSEARYRPDEKAVVS